MAAGELIAEAVAWVLVEFIFRGLFYWTGFLLLKVLSLGTLRLAPVATLGDRNFSKKRKPLLRDWSIWLGPASRPRRLRAELTCITGVLTWLAAGLAWLAIQ